MKKSIIVLTCLSSSLFSELPDMSDFWRKVSINDGFYKELVFKFREYNTCDISDNAQELYNDELQFMLMFFYASYLENNEPGMKFYSDSIIAHCMKKN